LIEKIDSFIKAYHLVAPTDKIFAAVSGGVDSMVMLYCLNTLKKQLNFELSVIHVNHGVRTGDSDEDENLVQVCCNKYKLENHVKKLNGFNLESSENELRNARYAAFNEILQQFPEAKIATAHTLDDQIETFFMRLAKGSKLKGLCGIPEKRDAFIRPMLSSTKKEIYQFARNEQIPYHEDYTNKDTKKLRNRIRHKLIPKFTEIFGENFYEGFQRSQQDLKAVQSAFLETMQSISLEYVSEKENGLEIDLKDYQKLSLTEKRHLINGCVSKFYPLNFQIKSAYFEQFERFANDASTGSQFLFENNLNVIKNRKTIYFSIIQNESSEELELYPGQIVYLGRNKISLKTVEDGDRAVNNDRCT
jgi:tRNA(Ile)-lysidine synthase